jgi:hypothetical protein
MPTRKNKLVTDSKDRRAFDRRARHEFDIVLQQLDMLWDTLQDRSGMTLQQERDTAMHAIQAMLHAAGVSVL